MEVTLARAEALMRRVNAAATLCADRGVPLPQPPCQWFLPSSASPQSKSRTRLPAGTAVQIEVADLRNALRHIIDHRCHTVYQPDEEDARELVDKLEECVSRARGARCALLARTGWGCSVGRARR